jgi:ribosomal protein L16/L10AE
LEASRITFNRYLIEKLTRERYTSKLLIFPHHILRENKRAMGIGADRVSKGMKHAYGKAIGRAAIIHKGNRIFRIDFDKEGLKHINVALKKAQSKLGMKLKIVIKENKLTEEDRKRNIAITEIYREKLKKRGAELEAGLETAVAPTAVGAEAATAPTAELTSEATAHATSETKAKEQKAQEKEEKKK